MTSPSALLTRAWWLTAAVMGLTVGYGVFVSFDPSFDLWRSFAAGVLVEQFRLQDPVWLGFGAALLVLIALLAQRLRVPMPRWLTPGAVIAGSAVFATVIAVAGVDLVHLRTPLSLDEFLAGFQAQTLANGYLVQPIDPEWAGRAGQLQPQWVRFDAIHGVWGPNYLPGNGAWIALFLKLGLGPWAHAVTVGAIPILTASVAQRVLPPSKWGPALAAVLLATSPQVLITASTWYAMTPHLIVSLVWLRLFLRRDTTGYLLAALVAPIAIGMHQPHIHPAIAAPFLLHLLFTRKWGPAIGLLVWYAAWGLFWLMWRDLLVAGAPVVGSASEGETSYILNRVWRFFTNHGIRDLYLWFASIGRFIGWQHLALVPLLAAGVAMLRRAPIDVVLLAIGAALMLVPPLLLMPSQGHGWGYRYLHPALGNLAIIAAFTWTQLEDRRGFGAWIAWATVATIVLALPLRAVQTRAFISGPAAAVSFLQSLDDDVIIVDEEPVWFGLDLVRNPPELSGPHQLAGRAIDAQSLADLCSEHRVVWVPAQALVQLGMQRRPARRYTPPTQTWPERLKAAGCASIERWPSASTAME